MFLVSGGLCVVYEHGLGLSSLQFPQCFSTPSACDPLYHTRYSEIHWYFKKLDFVFVGLRVTLSACRVCVLHFVAWLGGRISFESIVAVVNVL